MTTRFLIDANTSSRSRHWQTPEFEPVPDSRWSDSRIWQYATERNLTIITKDNHFVDRALNGAPPQVVLFDVRNMRRRPFRELLIEIWPRILQALEQPGARLVRVYPDRLEVI